MVLEVQAVGWISRSHFSNFQAKVCFFVFSVKLTEQTVEVEFAIEGSDQRTPAQERTIYTTTVQTATGVCGVGGDQRTQRVSRCL